MPRLTTPDYLVRYHQLHDWWTDNKIVFRVISPTDQWALHGFFRFAEPLSEPVLLVHRRRVTEDDPSLPHRAGRAYAKLERRIAQVDWTTYGTLASPPRVRSTLTGKDRHVSVHSVVRPDVDVHRIARALVDQILRAAQREDDDQAA